MARGAVQKYGAWNAAFLDADPSFVRERVQEQDIADSAVFENIGYATLDEGANPGKPYLFIAGFEEETFDALPTTLIWGETARKRQRSPDFRKTPDRRRRFLSCRR